MSTANQGENPARQNPAGDPARQYALKYGCNPHQTPAGIFTRQGSLPIEFLNGRAGYINLLDALNAWQLVRELKEATGLAAAASFKHVSPAGAAVAVPLDPTEKRMYFAREEAYSDIATAYIRARGADRVSSYGDFAALSDGCDEDTARYFSNEVSDGIIAPSYSDKALEILKNKRKGNYLIIRVDAEYQPPVMETKDVFGITFEQRRNDVQITPKMLSNVVTRNRNLPQEAVRDLLIACVALKYTQSNSVCFAKHGQTIGIGAGQQSRIHCTRLAGEKADIWRLRSHPALLSLSFLPHVKPYDRDNAIDAVIRGDAYIFSGWQAVLHEKPNELPDEARSRWLKSSEGVALGSDAFFPFGDNIERACQSGVQYIVQPGGSIRDEQVIGVCDKHGIVMAFTGVRLFHH